MTLKVPAPVEAQEFLKEAAFEPVSEDALAKLEDAVDRFQLLEAIIKEQEEELSKSKKSLLILSQVDIPELLHSHGLSEIKLKSKKKVIVSQGVSASVPDEKQEAFNDFLKKHNAEDLVKLQMSFSRMPESKQHALFAFLGALEYEYDAKKAVHPSTLKKYVSDLLGLGVDDAERAEGIKTGAFMRAEDLQNVMNIFTFFSTKIKEPK